MKIGHPVLIVAAEQLCSQCPGRAGVAIPRSEQVTVNGKNVHWQGRGACISGVIPRDIHGKCMLTPAEAVAEIEALPLIFAGRYYPVRNSRSLALSFITKPRIK